MGGSAVVGDEEGRGERREVKEKGKKISGQLGLEARKKRGGKRRKGKNKQRIFQTSGLWCRVTTCSSSILGGYRGLH